MDFSYDTVKSEVILSGLTPSIYWITDRLNAEPHPEFTALCEQGSPPTS